MRMCLLCVCLRGRSIQKSCDLTYLDVCCGVLWQSACSHAQLEAGAVLPAHRHPRVARRSVHHLLHAPLSRHPSVHSPLLLPLPISFPSPSPALLICLLFAAQILQAFGQKNVHPKADQQTAETDRTGHSAQRRRRACDCGHSGAHAKAVRNGGVATVSSAARVFGPVYVPPSPSPPPISLSALCLSHSLLPLIRFW
jgi:hypothetical protein